MKILVACVVLVGVVGGSASAAPPWCQGAPTSERADADQVKQALDDYGGKAQNVRFVVKAARLLCGAPSAPGAKDVLAAWKKETGLDEAGAVASLEARTSPRWDTDYEALCKSLPPTDGDKSDANARMDARRSLFTCESSDPEGAWMLRPQQLRDAATLLDRGVLDREGDEVVRLAYVFGEVGHMLDPAEDSKVLANYVVAQFDIKAVRYDAALKQLDAAPYRGNRYARTIVLETIAFTKAQIVRLDAAIATRTKDATWKKLLLTVPQQAAREWLAAAAKYKDMLTHGRSASGCDTLRADVASLAKPIAAKTADISVIEATLADNPIAGLVIWRWAHCLGDQGDNDMTKTVSIFSQNVPPVQGPRAAAYRAVRAAIAAIKRPPFDYHDFDDPEPMQWGEVGGSPSSLSRGVVKSTKPTKAGLAVTFVSDKYKYMSRACKDTKVISRVDDEGRISYKQECHDAGMAVGDHAPEPTTLAKGCTEGVAKGRFVWLEWSVPWLVFADKSSKRLVAAYCVPLD